MTRRKAKKYEGLFQRKDGWIWLSLSHEGQRIRKSCKTKDWDEAKRVRNALMAGLKATPEPLAPIVSFADVAKLFLSEGMSPLKQTTRSDRRAQA